MRKLRVIWQGTFVVFCYIVFTQGLADEGTDGIRTSLEADDLAVVSAGEKVYQENCASCHGDQLEGQPNWRLRDANGYLPAPPMMILDTPGTTQTIYYSRLLSMGQRRSSVTLLTKR